MSIKFSIKDFFYPLSIYKFRSFLEKSQWFSPEEMRAYQFKRLQTVLIHAYKNVPYYTQLFDGLRLKPDDIQSVSDLSKIPLLTKDIIKKNFKMLVSRNSSAYKPKLYKTSGTTGEISSFYIDRQTNVLEFCYYWRYWSWAGYKLGSPFAEFTLHHFLDSDIHQAAYYSAITQRLCLNPSQLSLDNVGGMISSIRKYRIAFLKGSPSSIYAFAMLVQKKGISDVSFKAIFTTGELLLPHQKAKIEGVFHSKIMDSYGHMERTVAISHCPEGGFHINSDYGFCEIDQTPTLKEQNIGMIVGTGLYNFSMPLIRYATGDFTEVASTPQSCSCGRTLPLSGKIIGREQNIIWTPDGRMVSNIFILFSILKGAAWVQIIQETHSRLRVRILKDDDYSLESEQEFFLALSRLLGHGMQVEKEFISKEAYEIIKKKKHSPVISLIPNLL